LTSQSKIECEKSGIGNGNGIGGDAASFGGGFVLSCAAAFLERLHPFFVVVVVVVVQFFRRGICPSGKAKRSSTAKPSKCRRKSLKNRKTLGDYVTTRLKTPIRFEGDIKIERDPSLSGHYIATHSIHPKLPTSYSGFAWTKAQ